MCGIAGFISLNQPIDHPKSHLDSALQKLKNRGPDAHGIYRDENCELGHTRLSILDTSTAANQPMTSENNRYTIIFNGEIYNFENLRIDLEKSYGLNIKTSSDTEVLLNGLILEGKSFIEKLNGFFAFCFYDKIKNYYLLARDRFGIKPLLYSHQKNQFIFSSELKSLMCYPISKELDQIALNQFLQFTYIPSPRTILKKGKKLQPGHLIEIENKKVSIEKYFTFYPCEKSTDDYVTAQKKVKGLLNKAVQKRLISDVPLGTFLSGGIDSSIVSAISAKHKTNLETFSIGFPDEPLFDESKYAADVAKHIGSKHHCFQLTNKQLFNHLDQFLAYLDEPMADSSALNIFLLSQETKKHVTVSLSGDGADELFSGYNKHQALYFSLQKNWKTKLIKNYGNLSKLLPSSRNSKLGNFGRQLHKLHQGLNLNNEERYFQWASFMDQEMVQQLSDSYYDIENQFHIDKSDDIFNDFLFKDFNLVLENDMLRKVDLMSMSQSLEVRTPFLDHKLVEYVFSLPSKYKIGHNKRKKILKDAFKDELPAEIFNRKKHGFEIPLDKWFRGKLKSFIDDEIFENNVAVKEGILSKNGIVSLKKSWYENPIGNAPYHIWTMIVLNNFLKKYIF